MVLTYAGRMWFDLGNCGCKISLKLRGIADGSGESGRLFHSLQKRLNRLTPPLVSRKLYTEEQENEGK